jgi:hypothetical protein
VHVACAVLFAGSDLRGTVGFGRRFSRRRKGLHATRTRCLVTFSRCSRTCLGGLLGRFLLAATEGVPFGGRGSEQDVPEPLVVSPTVFLCTWGGGFALPQAFPAMLPSLWACCPASSAAFCAVLGGAPAALCRASLAPPSVSIAVTPYDASGAVSTLDAAKRLSAMRAEVVFSHHLLDVCSVARASHFWRAMLKRAYLPAPSSCVAYADGCGGSFKQHLNAYMFQPLWQFTHGCFPCHYGFFFFFFFCVQGAWAATYAW